MQYVKITPKKGDEPQEFLIKSDSVVGIVEAINKKGLSLEETEKIAGITTGCIMEAIDKGDMLTVNDFHKLIEILWETKRGNNSSFFNIYLFLVK